MERFRLLLRRLVDPPRLAAFARQIHGREVRHALLFCLPAAAVAIGLRVWLLISMPAAFVHNDTASILHTPARLVENGVLELDSKKTFLTPLLYCAPALARVPVLEFASAIQHFFGVLLVFVTGLAAMAWFSRWRLWIIPLTIAIAINPVLLWYEHTALPESTAVLGAVLVALAGTFFFRQANRYTLALLFMTILFAAGARPEGRLFSLFGIVLVARAFWSDRSRLWPGLAVSVVLAMLVFLGTRTGQSGLLLYASLIQWSPQKFLFSPRIAESLRPVQMDAVREWQNPSGPKLVRLRKSTQDAIAAFLKENGETAKAAKVGVERISKRAGLEIAARNFWRLPVLALRKFVIAHRELPCMDFFDYPLSGQWSVLYENDDTDAIEHSKMLWGTALASPEQAWSFLQSRYNLRTGAILTHFLNAFVRSGLYSIAPLRLPGSEIANVPIIGLPWLYACALAGAVSLALRERPVIGFHAIWILFLAGLFVVLMATANVRARFRLIFEPFWYIYLFALMDSARACMSKIPKRLLKNPCASRSQGCVAFWFGTVLRVGHRPMKGMLPPRALPKPKNQSATRRAWIFQQSPQRWNR